MAAVSATAAAPSSNVSRSCGSRHTSLPSSSVRRSALAPISARALAAFAICAALSVAFVLKSSKVSFIEPATAPAISLTSAATSAACALHRSAFSFAVAANSSARITDRAGGEFAGVRSRLANSESYEDRGDRRPRPEPPRQAGADGQRRRRIGGGARLQISEEMLRPIRQGRLGLFKELVAEVAHFAHDVCLETRNGSGRTQLPEVTAKPLASSLDLAFERVEFSLGHRPPRPGWVVVPAVEAGFAAP